MTINSEMASFLPVPLLAEIYVGGGGESYFFAIAILNGAYYSCWLGSTVDEHGHNNTFNVNILIFCFIHKYFGAQHLCEPDTLEEHYGC